jgi:hypothetical protein
MFEDGFLVIGVHKLEEIYSVRKYEILSSYIIVGSGANDIQCATVREKSLRILH